MASDLYPILRFAFKKLQFLLPKLVPNGNNEGSVLLRNNNTREGMQTKVLNTKQRGYLASRPAALEFWCDLWTLGCNQLWNGISFGALPSVWLQHCMRMYICMISGSESYWAFIQSNFCYLAFSQKKTFVWVQKLEKRQV